MHNMRKRWFMIYSFTVLIMFVTIVLFISSNNKEKINKKQLISETDGKSGQIIPVKAGDLEINEYVEKVTDSGEKYLLKEKNEIIQWNCDLTGDGANEKILVNTDSINDDLTNTVEVYSGKTGELIWNRHLDSVHANKLSICIYENEDRNYLMIWDPAMWQGSAVYKYSIFMLTEDGKEIEYENKEIDFDVYYCNEDDIERVIEFSYEVNDKLKDSFLIVSTLNDEISYSTADNIKIANFNPESEVGSMVVNLYANRDLT